MRFESVTNLVQVITGIAVLAGMLLVVYELRQTQDLTRAQLASDGWVDINTTARTTMGENFSATLAKACTNPSALTEEELWQLNSYWDVLIDQIARLKGYSDIGSHYIDWQGLARRNLGRYLSTPPGRRDWEVRKEFVFPFIKEVGDEIIGEDRLYSCTEFIHDHSQPYDKP